MSLDPLVEEPDAGSEVFPYSTNQADHVFPTLVISSSFARLVTGVSPPTPVLYNAWDGGTAPTNLANASDNDFGTKTTTGSHTQSGNPSGIIWDFGTVEARKMHIKFEHSNNASVGSVSVQSSVDGVSYITIVSYTNTSSTVIRDVTSDYIVPFRYLRISSTGAGANTSFLAFYDAREEEVLHTPEATKDGVTSTYWQSNSELNPNVRGEYSTLVDKEPSQIALYVDKSKLDVLQFLIQTSPDGTTWMTKRTVNISQLADLQYNFIRFNRDILPIRYIRVIGNDSIAKQFSISEFKALIPDEIQWANRQAHKTISTTGIVGLSG